MPEKPHFGPIHPHAGAPFIAELFADLNTFEQFEERIIALPTERARGAAFEVFAEAWLATQRISQARKIWPADSVPSEIQTKLRLPLKDMGVDGVFDTALDEYVCYQAKYRTGRPSLAWGEIATFFGLADFAAQRLLFTNCDDVSQIAEQRRDVIFVRGSDLDRLTAEDFRAISDWIAGAAVASPKKTPKPHQEKAIEKIVDALKKKHRVTALMACGTGKTLVALWTAERLQARVVLVLEPSLALVRQVLHEWLHETSWPDIEYLCVCSDESVDRGNDELIVRPSDVDFRVTTNSSAVRDFLTRESPATKVIFSTYQSTAVVAAATENLDAFDFAVFDEAHKTAGREGAKFGIALSDERLRIDRRLFMTATPRHYDVGVRDKSGDAKLVYSMDVLEVYGPVAYRISFGEAAKLGIISDYKVIISVVTSEMVTNELLRRGTVLVKGEEIKAAQVANQIALQRAVEEHGVRKIFSFHSRIAAAESFTCARPEGIRQHLPNFSCFFVNGAMSAAYRDKLLREFGSADQGIMSNARCLTEGVDLPAVDMVGFFSPKRSLVDIVQATGRAMRRAPGKNFGYVLVPLYLEQTRGETVEEAVSRSKFDEVWHILERLREHDDLLAQIIADMRVERGRTGGYDDSRFRERVEVLGPAVSLEDLRRSITSACLDALGESWFERYGELVAYKEQHGHCDVPKRSVGKLKKLANWVVQQRVSRNDGTLSREKIELLDRLRFKWSPYGHRWRENYLALVEFKQRFGNCRVPQGWKENKKLATWICTQRLRRKAGQLSSDRIQALDKLGFDWEIDVTIWEDRFKELCEYKERFGHTRVHVKWPENPQLGAWVVHQRYNRRRAKINPTHQARLDQIGFEWDISERDPTEWDQMFAKLELYKQEHGNCRVPSQNEHQKLSEWCQTQRRRFRLGKLLERRKKKLEEIGFEWSISNSADKWNEMFRQLAEHHKRTGSCAFTSGDQSKRSLKSWCVRQRKLYRLGQLSVEYVSKLDDLSFRWSPRHDVNRSVTVDEAARLEAVWNEKFNELLEFFKIHGHYDVPQGWRPNPKLASWVSAQRAAYRRGELGAERIERLSALGFPWHPSEQKWHQMYHALLTYHQRFGHTRVPVNWKENRRLAHWVAVQRRQKKLGRLSADRIAKLNLLAFEWIIRRRAPVDGTQVRRVRRPRGEAKRNQWEEMLAALKAFKIEHGHCRVPQRYEENTRLADWVSRVRTRRNKRTLPAEQEKVLTDLGFDWNPIATKWDMMFRSLVEYKKRFGHTNVPQKSREYPELAAWVANERHDKKKRKPISASRAARLDALGFTWEFNPAFTWEDMFNALVEFKKVYGHCNVPQHWKENKRLGKWVNTQRTARKRGKISAEREVKLNEIGFAWNLAPTNKRLVPLSTSIAA